MKFTLKLEASGGETIQSIIKDGLRIAELLDVEVETVINGIEVNIHPLDTELEIYEAYKNEQGEY